MNAIAKFEPNQFVEAISALDDERLAALCATPSVAPITRHARRVSQATIRRHDELQIGFQFNNFSRSNFASDLHRAWAIEDALPTRPELLAQQRFALAAVATPAPRDAIAMIITHLAKVLQFGAGGGTPERIMAVVDVLDDNEDERTHYGQNLQGFSVPIVQVAVNSILARSKWFPAPVELLDECRVARSFFWSVAHAAGRQAELVHEAQALIEAAPPSDDRPDDELPF